MFVLNSFVEVKPEAASYVCDLSVGKQYQLFVDEDGDLVFIDDEGDHRSYRSNSEDLILITSTANDEDRSFKLADLLELFEGTDSYFCIESRGMFFNFMDQEYVIASDVEMDAAISMVKAHKELTK